MTDVSNSTPTTDPVLSKAVNQAAAWIAFHHGPGRTPASEQGLRDWLAENPLHQQAFELATDLWNEHRALVRRSAKVRFMLPGEREARRFPGRLRAACIVVLALMLMVGGFYATGQPETFSTGVAEQLVVFLEDGTRVALNAESRIFKEYSKKERRIRWKSGEAVFNVAKNKKWPFVVVAGDREVKAVGTSFHMRVEDKDVAVALIDGKVTVSSVASDTGVVNHNSPPEYTLLPGQRVQFKGSATQPEWDLPSLESLTAWQHGMVDIDNLQLADAVREMNRYSTVRLRVEARNWERVRVGGSFKIGDSLSFARYVATQQRWQVEQRGGQIVLVD